MAKTGIELWDEIDRKNLAAAKIILADPERYPGAMQLSAQRTVAKARFRLHAEQQRRAKLSPQTPGDAAGNTI